MPWPWLKVQVPSQTEWNHSLGSPAASPGLCHWAHLSRVGKAQLREQLCCNPTAPAQTHHGAAPAEAQLIPMPETLTGRGLGEQQSHFPGVSIQLKGLQSLFNCARVPLNSVATEGAVPNKSLFTRTRCLRWETLQIRQEVKKKKLKIHQDDTDPPDFCRAEQGWLPSQLEEGFI